MDLKSKTAGAPILLVDDDPDVRDIVSELLRRQGYVVLLATNGVEALEALHDHPSVRLVISDVRMPQMSGLELAERAVALNPLIKVVLISGYFDTQAAGPRFLRKPFSKQQLEDVVRAELAEQPRL